MVSCRAPPSLVPKQTKTMPFSESSLRTNCRAQDEAFFSTFNAAETCSLFLKQIKARLNAVEMKLLSLKSLKISEQYLKCRKGNYQDSFLSFLLL